MINETVFYTNESKLATGTTGFAIYGENRPTCKISASLELNTTVFQSEILAINAAVSD